MAQPVARAKTAVRAHLGTSDGGAGAKVGRGEIEEIVQSVVVSLRGDLSMNDLTLYHELEGLVRFIHAAKAEIAALRPTEIQEKDLPAATDELDAVVGATEQATSGILDAVEKIEAIAGRLGNEAGEEIGGLVTNIYEACNFQDITGQRITKVVRTLKHIETKIAALASAFGANVATPADDGDDVAAPVAAQPSDADLLNGPQLPSNANSQEDIDALFSKA